MRIVGVNGINTHGETNIDVLLARLRERGWDTVDVRLPKRHFVSAWWGAKSDAEIIVDNSRDGDVVVAHSFGCLRAAYAMRRREYNAAFMIAPAMSRKWQFYNPRRVYCYCSGDDYTVLAGALIPFKHPFGMAGLRGFDQLPDENIIYKRSDHDDYFSGVLLDQLVDHVDHVARLYDGRRNS